MFGLGKFSQDKKFANYYCGFEVTREQFDAYKESGTLKKLFGERVKPSGDLGHQYGTSLEIVSVERILVMLDHLQKSDVVIDLEKPENKTAVHLLTRGISSVGSNYSGILKIPAPYNEHPPIKDWANEWRESLAKRQGCEISAVREISL